MRHTVRSPARGRCIGLPALNRHHVSVVEDLLGIDRGVSAPLHRARRTILGPFRCFGRARQVFKARRMSAIERSRSTPAIHSWSSQTQHYSLVPSNHYSSPSSHPNKFLTKQLSPRASNASTRHNRPMAHWHKGARMVSDAQAPPKHCRSQAVSSLYWLGDQEMLTISRLSWWKGATPRATPIAGDLAATARPGRVSPSDPEGC